MSTTTANVKFTQPPVSQVRFTFFFSNLFKLSSHQLGGLLDHWKDSYPKVSESPPSPPVNSYDLDTEKLSEDYETWPLPLFVFEDTANGRTLLLQSDRLAIVWDLDVEAGQPYPGFSVLRAEVLKRLGELDLRLEQQKLSPTTIIRTEGRYINEVAGLSTGEYIADMLFGTSKSIDRKSTILSPQENVSLTRHIHSGEDSDSPAWITVRSNNDSGMSLLITAQKNEEFSNAADALDACHDLVLQCFVSSTSEAMRENWGQFS